MYLLTYPLYLQHTILLFIILHMSIATCPSDIFNLILNQFSTFDIHDQYQYQNALVFALKTFRLVCKDTKKLVASHSYVLSRLKPDKFPTALDASDLCYAIESKNIGFIKMCLCELDNYSFSSRIVDLVIISRKTEIYNLFADAGWFNFYSHSDSYKIAAINEDKDMMISIHNHPSNIDFRDKIYDVFISSFSFAGTKCFNPKYWNIYDWLYATFRS